MTESDRKELEDLKNEPEPGFEDEYETEDDQDDMATPEEVQEEEEADDSEEDEEAEGAGEEVVDEDDDEDWDESLPDPGVVSDPDTNPDPDDLDY